MAGLMSGAFRSAVIVMHTLSLPSVCCRVVFSVVSIIFLSKIRLNLEPFSCAAVPWQNEEASPPSHSRELLGLQLNHDILTKMSSQRK